MSKIDVYDPALCCSTGVCGAEVDQDLVDFSGLVTPGRGGLPVVSLDSDAAGGCGPGCGSC